MNKKISRETKMSMLTYGGVFSAYAVILYVFLLFLFPDTIGMFQIKELVNAYNISLNKAFIIAFIYIATIIAIYKVTKDMKSNYIKAVSMFVIPSMIILIFENHLNTIVILMAMAFMVRGIYKITPKVNKLWVKLLKFVIISISIIIVSVIIIEIKNNYLLIQINQPLTYNAQGFLEVSKKMIYDIYLMFKFDETTTIVIAAFLFMSFTTKEIIKEVLNTYKPTDKEIGNLVLGTIIIFIVVVISTSSIQYVYKMNMPKGNEKKLMQINRQIKDMLINENLNLDSKSITKETVEIKFNKIILKVLNASSQYSYDDMELMDVGSSELSEKSVLSFIYTVDLSKIMLEYNKKIYNITDKNKIQQINNETILLIDALENRIIENNIKVQSAIYNLMLGLLGMFVIIEIYEQIRIVKMLKNKEGELK